LLLNVSGCGPPTGREALTGETPLEVGVEELYTVGALEGEESEVFGRIGAVAFSSNGSLYVLDEGALKVVVVEPGGEGVRQVAAKGDGPGELSGAAGLAVLVDGTLVVNDLVRGFHLYGSDATYRHTAPFDRGIVPSSGIWGSGDGSVISTIRRRVVGSSGAEGQLARYPLDRAGAALELLTTAEGEGDGALALAVPQLFGATIRFAVASDGAIIIVRRAGYEVEVLSAGDDPWETLLTRSVVPQPVTDDLVQAEIQRRLNRRMAELGEFSAAMGTDPAAFRAMAEQVLGRLPVADVVPVITSLSVDREDRIWIERFGQDPHSSGPIDVFTRMGEYVGTIAADGLPFPDAFGPSGEVAYIDNDGPVPMVRVQRLVGQLRTQN